MTCSCHVRHDWEDEGWEEGTFRTRHSHLQVSWMRQMKWNVVNVALLALPGVVDFSLFFISWPVYPIKQSYKIFYPLCSTY